MTDTYHIQISVYVRADTIHGAKAAAQICKNCIPDGFSESNNLDEVIIDSVGIEQTGEFPGNTKLPKSTAK